MVSQKGWFSEHSGILRYTSLVKTIAEMKCCRKMVLVPRDQCSLLLKAQVQDIPPVIKKSIQLEDHMSQILTQDDSSAPENHTKLKVFVRLFRDYMHCYNYDIIYSFTHTSPSLEAAPAAIQLLLRMHHLLRFLILARFWDIYCTCIKQKVGFCFTI